MNRDSPQTPPQIERPVNAEEHGFLDQHMPRRLFGSPKRRLSPSPRSPTKRRRHGGKNRYSRKNRSLSRKQRR